MLLEIVGIRLRNVQCRIVRAKFMLALAAITCISGCSEKAPTPTATKTGEKDAVVYLDPKEVFGTPEHQLAALIKSADAGDAEAQFKLGLVYAKGEDVDKDDVKAFALFQKSATQGNAKGQNGLGLFYEGGRGVSKDLAKAVEWYQKSAAQNNPDGLFNLGMMHALGSGLPKDAIKAEELWLKAADSGSELAITTLGLRYATLAMNEADKPWNRNWKQDGFEPDKPAHSAVDQSLEQSNSFTEVLAFYRKYAERGSATAQFKLGMMYAFGTGVSKDNQMALEWFRKSATQGDALAQYELGRTFLHGNTVPKDASIAAEWFKKAAVQGYSPSQRILAMLYAGGFGVPNDLVLAYAWMNLAATTYASDPDALRERQKMEPHLSKDELAEAQRLSSGWKNGQLLFREGSLDGVVKPSLTGSMVKAGSGSLFMVSKSGYAITNQHVAGGCTELRVLGREGVAKLITDDKVNDLALVQVQGEVKDFARISSDPGKLRQGEDVVVFGFPLSSVLSSGGNLTPGIVSALTGLGNNTNQIQITAPIQPGSSGSPVLNKKGDVIGVVSAKLSDAKMAKTTGQVGQNINFAVSGQTLKAFLDTNKVDYSTSRMFTLDKSTADQADQARKWTVVVECWK